MGRRQKQSLSVFYVVTKKLVLLMAKKITLKSKMGLCALHMMLSNVYWTV